MGCMKKRMAWMIILMLFLMLLVMSIGCEMVPVQTLPPLPDPENPLLRSTKFGLVEGVEDDFDTWSWRGIPFAAPPVDEKRWRAPRDPQKWSDVLETKAFSDICPQYVIDSDDPESAEIRGTEDCLYLNIWQPRQAQPKPLPVYVWIHGGGNSIQMPFNSSMKGAKLAHMSDLIVVNFNYRLGPMGWFVHPAFKTDNALDNSGNFGTLDIIKVLTWVKNNIRSFGGDPKNVTIAGESAGGLNIMSLVISEPAKGLFHKAIVESGGAMASTMEAAEEHANMIVSKLLIKDEVAENAAAVAEYLDTTSNADLRKYLLSKTAKEFLQCYDAGQGGMVSTPNILKDGTVIPANGFETLTAGTYPNKVPMIIGANTYEAKLFLYQSPTFESVRTGEASQYLIEKYGVVTQAHIDDNIELYGLVSKYLSDLMLVSGVDANVRKLAANLMQPPVYAYQFNWGAAENPCDGVLPDRYGFLVGAAHGTEIDFFFGLAGGEGVQTDSMFSAGYTEENKAGREDLMNAINDYIRTFAYTGAPNRPDSNLPVWSPWKISMNEAPKRIIFDADFDKHTIEMSTKARNMMGVMMAMRSEPNFAELQKFMSSFMESFGPMEGLEME